MTHAVLSSQPDNWLKLNASLFGLLETPTNDAIVMYDAYKKEKHYIGDDKPGKKKFKSDTVLAENKILVCVYSK